MSRYVGPNCRFCRREGAKLFLKGERCNLEKCAFERRSYAPGQHGQGMRRKQSDYSVQLRAKQKLSRIYGLREGQFRKYYREATRVPGVSGENFLRLLEGRLDNIVFRLGMAPSRKAARQLVRHSHFTVNGRRVNIPSFLTKPGDVIQVGVASKQLEVIQESMRRSREPLPWLAVDKVNLQGTVLERPSRDNIPTVADEQLVIEFYSRV
ncbi:MAG: 30S ribosomal protein S4 [Candidatus Handelsmanbacteria bacterium]|nr:30S ribosomal protein S4 [Candidatus Handelsmanbacteria bacterium]